MEAQRTVRSERCWRGAGEVLETLGNELELSHQWENKGNPLHTKTPQHPWTNSTMLICYLKTNSWVTLTSEHFLIYTTTKLKHRANTVSSPLRLIHKNNFQSFYFNFSIYYYCGGHTRVEITGQIGASSNVEFREVLGFWSKPFSLAQSFHLKEQVSNKLCNFISTSPLWITFPKIQGRCRALLNLKEHRGHKRR